MLEELIQSVRFAELADTKAQDSPDEPVRVSSLPAQTLSSEVDSINDDSRLPSVFPTSELAVSTVSLSAFQLQHLLEVLQLPARTPVIDARLSSLWFSDTLKPVGWQSPKAWDPVAGDYACADGWIRLHTNLAHHREAALRVLGCEGNREAVSAAVSDWRGDELESAIIEEGGCSAAMRSMQAWSVHPQGQALASEPLIHWDFADAPETHVAARKQRLIDAIRNLSLIHI